MLNDVDDGVHRITPHGNGIHERPLFRVTEAHEPIQSEHGCAVSADEELGQEAIEALLHFEGLNEGVHLGSHQGSHR